jgi:hypothetical protein
LGTPVGEAESLYAGLLSKRRQCFSLLGGVGKPLSHRGEE